MISLRFLSELSVSCFLSLIAFNLIFCFSIILASFFSSSAILNSSFSIILASFFASAILNVFSLFASATLLNFSVLASNTFTAFSLSARSFSFVSSFSASSFIFDCSFSARSFSFVSSFSASSFSFVSSFSATNLIFDCSFSWANLIFSREEKLIACVFSRFCWALSFLAALVAFNLLSSLLFAVWILAIEISLLDLNFSIAASSFKVILAFLNSSFWVSISILLLFLASVNLFLSWAFFLACALLSFIFCFSIEDFNTNSSSFFSSRSFFALAWRATISAFFLSAAFILSSFALLENFIFSCLLASFKEMASSLMSDLSLRDFSFAFAFSLSTLALSLLALISIFSFSNLSFSSFLLFSSSSLETKSASSFCLVDSTSESFSLSVSASSLSNLSLASSCSTSISCFFISSTFNSSLIFCNLFLEFLSSSSICTEYSFSLSEKSEFIFLIFSSIASWLATSKRLDLATIFAFFAAALFTWIRRLLALAISFFLFSLEILEILLLSSLILFSFVFCDLSLASNSRFLIS